MSGITDIDGREMERRKDRIRRAWAYRRVDHVPVGFFMEDLGRYSLREQCENGRIQFQVNYNCIDRFLRLLPDDYIPVARLWCGYVTLASMFGVAIHWSDNPNQAPGVAHHPIRDMSQVHGLRKPDAATSGLMPFNLRWIRYYRENFPPEVYFTGMDLGGPMNTAKDLLDTNLLYTAFFDSPEEYRRLLDLATAVQIECYRQYIAAAGGAERLSCIDFDPMWAPETAKGFVADDVCASFSPEIFRQFSRPFNNRIFRLWPGGRIHNCGPHPSIGEYLDHDPPINGLNCSWRHTRRDLPRIKQAFRGRGIVELMFDNGESPEEILRGYEDAANILAPDVVGVPLLMLNESWSDENIRGVYHDLVQVAQRYADQINWVGDASRS